MTDSNPLAKWRRPGQQVPDFAPAPATLPEYKAFGESAAPQRVWLKCGARAADHGPAYGYLTNVGTDTWSMVHLEYSIPMVVEIRGECLGSLAEAFMKGTAAWVQAFDPARFSAPADGAPLVREITVHRIRPEEVTRH
jgi:hypothetical protein